jgi:mannose-6-phosphate isomerase-like protein (cupin superfamily)
MGAPSAAGGDSVQAMMLRVLVYGSMGLLVLLGVAGCEPVTGPTPASSSNAVVRFDESYGSAPAAGWRWGLGLIAPEAQDITEPPTDHSFAWVFYVLSGSIEIGFSTGSRTIQSGAGTMVPAGQLHTHRFPAQSRVLVFRPADRPFGDFHRGTRLYESDGLLPVSAGRTYRIRVQEQILEPWLPSSVTTDTGVAYVAEGNLVVRDASADRVQPTGSAFGLRSNLVLLTAGAAPARVILVDLY